jgi:hypothetical protein
MTIPGFPVFWIGGLLFGAMFIFNGVRQWIEIRSLDGDSGRGTHAERLNQGGILTCRRCGRKNRVPSYSRKLRPVCGYCKAPLSESVFMIAKRVVLRVRPIWIATGVAVSAILLAVVAYQAATHMSIFSRLQTPHPQKSNQAQTSSRVLPVNISHPKNNSMPQINRRLANSTLIRSGALDGLGKLKINNGLSYDAAAKLIDRKNEKCVAYFYVTAGSVHTITGVPDGDYRLLFVVGEDWDNQAQLFTRPTGVSEFNKRLDFETRRRYEGDYVYQEHSVMEMTLHPVPGGNVKTHSISLEDFKKY